MQNQSSNKTLPLLAGVMGWPIAHSRSPRLHRYWLKKYGIQGDYVALPVKPENLARALSSLSAMGFQGVNITIPHKKAALELKTIVEKTDPLAQKVGAINTVVVGTDGKLFGQNTDVFGFIENLKSAGFKHQQGVATVLGAGGASRAVVVALKEMGFNQINLVNRTRIRAEQLAAAMDEKIQIFDWTEMEKTFQDTELLVNTTSLGMEGQPPLDINFQKLPPQSWVTDIVYSPIETEFLKKAVLKGHKKVDGLGMLLHQARPAFKAFFGTDPEVDADLRAYVMSNE